MSRTLTPRLCAALCAAALAPACVKDDPKTTESGPSTSRSANPASVAVARVEIAPSLERSCRQICDRSRQLKCPGVDKCLPNCLAMGSATPCTYEMLGFYDCLVAQPLPSWECAPDGVAAIRRGFCDNEQARTVACMEAKVH